MLAFINVTFEFEQSARDHTVLFWGISGPKRENPG